MYKWDEKLWQDKDFWERLKEICELGRIKSIAWHIVGENPGFSEGIERVYVRLEAESGTVKDLPAPMKIVVYEHFKAWYLIKIALNKVHLQNQPLNMKKVPFYVDGSLDFEAVDTTREIASYTGETWINEKRSRFYDNVIPEWVF